MCKCKCNPKPPRKGHVRTCQGSYRVKRTNRRTTSGRYLYEALGGTLVFALSRRAVKK